MTKFRFISCSLICLPGASCLGAAGISNLRHNHRLDEVLGRRVSGLKVVLEDVRRFNAASIFRTCDCLGIGEILWVHNPRDDGRGYGRGEFDPEEMKNIGLTPAIVKNSMGEE